MPYYSTCGTTTTSTNYKVWNDWNCGTAGTTSNCWTNFETNTFAQNCWIKWSDDKLVAYQPVAWNPPQETAEERKQRQQRDREIRAEIEARRKTEAAAEKKAEELFKEHLDEKQKEEVAKKRHFHVISEKGKRFRIHLDSAHGNVSELGEDGKVKRRLCAQPKGLPKFDQILAQKLALEHCEEQFLKVANAS